MEVNGFDMDYVHAGVGEDVDVEWRLKANGIKTKSMKNISIVYHIDHPKGYSEEMVKFNFKLMNEKQKENNIRCLNGLENIRFKI
jgi:GT2 family glycosyltransferase